MGVEKREDECVDENQNALQEAGDRNDAIAGT